MSLSNGLCSPIALAQNVLPRLPSEIHMAISHICFVFAQMPFKYIILLSLTSVDSAKNFAIHLDLVANPYFFLAC